MLEIQKMLDKAKATAGTKPRERGASFQENLERTFLVVQERKADSLTEYRYALLLAYLAAHAQDKVVDQFVAAPEHLSGAKEK